MSSSSHSPSTISSFSTSSPPLIPTIAIAKLISSTPSPSSSSSILPEVLSSSSTPIDENKSKSNLSLQSRSSYTSHSPSLHSLTDSASTSPSSSSSSSSPPSSSSPMSLPHPHSLLSPLELHQIMTLCTEQQKKNSQLMESNNILVFQYRKSQKEIQILQSQNHQSSSEFHLVTTENIRLKDENSHWAELIENVKIEIPQMISHHERQVEEIQKKYQEKEGRKIKDMEDKYRELQRKYEEIQDKVTSSSSSFQSKENEISHLKKEIDNEKVRNSSIKELLTETQEKCETLNTQNDKMMRENDNSQRFISQQKLIIHKLNDDVENGHREVGRLRAKVKQLENDLIVGGNEHRKVVEERDKLSVEVKNFPSILQNRLMDYNKISLLLDGEKKMREQDKATFTAKYKEVKDKYMKLKEQMAIVTQVNNHNKQNNEKNLTYSSVIEAKSIQDIKGESELSLLTSSPSSNYNMNSKSMAMNTSADDDSDDSLSPTNNQNISISSNRVNLSLASSNSNPQVKIESSSPSSSSPSPSPSPLVSPPPFPLMEISNTEAQFPMSSSSSSSPSPFLLSSTSRHSPTIPFPSSSSPLVATSSYSGNMSEDARNLLASILTVQSNDNHSVVSPLAPPSYPPLAHQISDVSYSSSSSSSPSSLFSSFSPSPSPVSPSMIQNQVSHSLQQPTQSTPYSFDIHSPSMSPSQTQYTNNNQFQFYSHPATSMATTPSPSHSSSLSSPLTTETQTPHNGNNPHSHHHHHDHDPDHNYDNDHYNDNYNENDSDDSPSSLDPMNIISPLFSGVSFENVSLSDRNQYAKQHALALNMFSFCWHFASTGHCAFPKFGTRCKYSVHITLREARERYFMINDMLDKKGQGIGQPQINEHILKFVVWKAIQNRRKLEKSGVIPKEITQMRNEREEEREREREREREGEKEKNSNFSNKRKFYMGRKEKDDREESDPKYVISYPNTWREKEREREREKDRESERDRDRERDKEREKERERERERERDMDRDRDSATRRTPKRQFHVVMKNSQREEDGEYGEREGERENKNANPYHYPSSTSTSTSHHPKYHSRAYNEDQVLPFESDRESHPNPYGILLYSDPQYPPVKIPRYVSDLPPIADQYVFTLINRLMIQPRFKPCINNLKGRCDGLRGCKHEHLTYSDTKRFLTEHYKLRGENS